ncbi:MAG: sulfate reduction electron transfer complex DsrMKJOP subunit DsrM [Nitrospiraceae bacterium]|nr:sulfate reduction electron transfer complex DsrMKJOP subunit DsrM [Nitrospiraceae bacterium]
MAVIFLILLVIAGVKAAGLYFLFGVVVPYAALAVFLAGVVFRVVKWGRSPVPFRIPTTCGQQKSLPWIKQNKIENPSSSCGVITRMLFEVFLFRSLFRNLKTEMYNGPEAHGGTKIAYGSDKWLWLGGLAFHWSMLIILIRHLRFFIQNVPAPVQMIEGLDSFLQIGLPLIYMTDVFFLGAVTYLLIRRFANPKVKYISLAADYFPLLLLLGIGTTGVLMRYFLRVDIVSVKKFTMSLVALNPTIVPGISSVFYVHLFLISTLFAYFPWSKLVHLGGVFLSPTRNLANNSREKRHINPWNAPVKVHTYAEYEDDFREKMKMAGLPVEKE